MFSVYKLAFHNRKLHFIYCLLQATATQSMDSFFNSCIATKDWHPMYVCLIHAVQPYNIVTAWPFMDFDILYNI